MSLKPLTLIAAVSFCCQVIFSIYYSTSIVDQNSLINIQQTNLDQLIIKNEQLQIKLSALNALPTVEEFTRNKFYTPVTSSMNLY